jgi:hypothetical protein
MPPHNATYGARHYDDDQWAPGAKRYAPCFVISEQQTQEEIRESFRSRKLVRCDQAPSVHAAAAAMSESRHGKGKQGADNGTISGLDRFNMVYKSVCSGLCFKPHMFQLEFFRQIIQSMAEGILGPNDWQRHGVSLMQRMGWTHNRKLCLASAPRRVGKTVILALVQVSVARYVPSVQITFSTGKRASDGLRNYVIKIMQNSGLGEFLSRAGQEELEVICIDGGDIVSVLKFFPANPDVRPIDVSRARVLLFVLCLEQMDGISLQREVRQQGKCNCLCLLFEKRYSGFLFLAAEISTSNKHGLSGGYGSPIASART